MEVDFEKEIIEYVKNVANLMCRYPTYILIIFSSLFSISTKLFLKKKGRKNKSFLMIRLSKHRKKHAVVGVGVVNCCCCRWVKTFLLTIDEQSLVLVD